MNTPIHLRAALALSAALLLAVTASAQIGRRFPSEKKIVPDPVTGIPLSFLTSTAAGDTKIYPATNGPRGITSIRPSAPTAPASKSSRRCSPRMGVP